jgi:hypothetical protein
MTLTDAFDVLVWVVIAACVYLLVAAWREERAWRCSRRRKE